jgi:hypothetical protein
MASYDPEVIRKYADQLYVDAERAPVLYAFAAGIVGMTVGLGLGVGLSSDAAGALTALILAVPAAFFGHRAGRSVGGRMRLDAQTALVQVAIEQHLRPK